ncbi:MAG: sugar ABC transporter permease [Cryobacterium sp.]|nr:sugar ABC transporter permease [Cryobacterium sp.]
MREHLRRNGWAYLFIAPAFIYYAVFVLGPISQTVYISFYDWDGITAATWVGIDNYVQVVSDPKIISALMHSLVFVIFYALLPVAIGLLFAGIFARTRIWGLTFFRAVLFSPQILSTVVVAVAWRWIYDIDGPLNAVFSFFGLGWLTRAWLGDFTTALPSVGLIGTWVMYGLCMVLFTAGVQKISRDIFESARLDGAGPIREFFAVTLPALRGEILFALIFTVTMALRNFDIVWNTTSGGPGDSTKVPSVFIYQAAFATRETGLSATIGVLLTLLILLVTGLIFLLLRKKD